MLQKIVVGAPSFDWDIERIALSFGQSPFACRAGSRIIGKLVNAKKKHRIIGFECVLGAIAVVHIPVDNRDSIDSTFGAQIVCSNRNIVEKAKAHDLVEFGMVPGGSDTTERVVGPVSQ